jgi:hypothetical protein
MGKFIQTYARDGHALKAIAYCIRHTPCSYYKKITSNLWMWGNAFFFFLITLEKRTYMQGSDLLYIYIYIYIYIEEAI